jgi:hypothetical protein
MYNGDITLMCAIYIEHIDIANLLFSRNDTNVNIIYRYVLLKRDTWSIFAI